MNFRQGFSRLAWAIIVLAWAIWGISAIVNGKEAFRIGEELVYGLLWTVGFMLFCKGVAWVFNGFFPPKT